MQIKNLKINTFIIPLQTKFKWVSPMSLGWSSFCLLAVALSAYNGKSLYSKLLVLHILMPLGLNFTFLIYMKCKLCVIADVEVYYSRSVSCGYDCVCYVAVVKTWVHPTTWADWSPSACWKLASQKYSTTGSWPEPQTQTGIPSTQRRLTMLVAALFVFLIMPPFEEKGHIVLLMSAGRSVYLFVRWPNGFPPLSWNIFITELSYFTCWLILVRRRTLLI